MTFDCVCTLDAVYRGGLAGAANNDGIHDGQVYQRHRYREDFWSLVVICRHSAGSLLSSSFLFFSIIFLL